MIYFIRHCNFPTQSLSRNGLIQTFVTIASQFNISCPAWHVTGLCFCFTASSRSHCVAPAASSVTKSSTMQDQTRKCFYSSGSQKFSKMRGNAKTIFRINLVLCTFHPSFDTLITRTGLTNSYLSVQTLHRFIYYYLYKCNWLFCRPFLSLHKVTIVINKKFDHLRNNK